MLLCKEDSEISLHFLGSCVARMAIRRYIMSSEALRQLCFSTLLRFAKASEIHITIPVSGVAFWTQTVASALGGGIDDGAQPHP